MYLFFIIEPIKFSRQLQYLSISLSHGFLGEKRAGWKSNDIKKKKEMFVADVCISGKDACPRDIRESSVE